MIEPYYSDEMVTIYHGRCEDVLPQLGRFDLLLTDIPYGEVNRQDNGLRSLDRGAADVETVSPDDVVGLVSGATDCAYVFCGTEQVSPLRAGMVAAGYSTRVCVWEKTNPPVLNAQHLWLSSIELCVFGKRNGAHYGAGYASPVWRGKSEPQDFHPTAKPVWLMNVILRASAPPSGTVLDPFMGSGTTLVACRKAGIRSVGIDAEEKYCEIAAKRVSQRSLFEQAQ